MKRLELNVKIVVVLLLAAGLVVGLLFDDKQSPNVMKGEVDLDLKVAIGTEKLRE